MGTAERARKITRARVTGPLADKFQRELLLWKMSPAKIEAAKEGILFLLQQGHFDPNTSGELLAVCNEALETLKARSVTRRKILKKGLIGGGVLVGGTTGLGLIIQACDNIFGPTAQARWKAESETYDKSLEANNVLGIIPSVPSYAGWSVRYATQQESRQLLDTPVRSKPFSPKYYILVPSNILGEKDDTGIQISEYVRPSDKVSVGKLSVFRDSLSIRTEFVLRLESTETIDANILVFENKSAEKIQFLRITRFTSANSDRLTFQLSVLQKASK